MHDLWPIPTTWGALAAENRALAATLGHGAALMLRAADARRRLARTARAWGLGTLGLCVVLLAAGAWAPALVALAGALGFGVVRRAYDDGAERCLTIAARASTEARECAARAAECLAWGRVRGEP